MAVFSAGLNSLLRAINPAFKTLLLAWFWLRLDTEGLWYKMVNTHLMFEANKQVYCALITHIEHNTFILHCAVVPYYLSMATMF